MCKPCEHCDCKCWILDEQCIVDLTNIQDTASIKHNHINDTNDNLDDLLGIKCAEELCQATAKAVDDLNVYNDSKQPEDPEMTVLDFLEDKWKNVITNKHFKRWYAKRVEYNWLNGSSITELKDVGLITSSNDDGDYDNKFKHADEKQRARLTGVAMDWAEKSKRKFQLTYWFRNISLYNCLGDCCRMKYYDEYQEIYGTPKITNEENCQYPYNGLGSSIESDIL